MTLFLKREFTASEVSKERFSVYFISHILLPCTKFHLIWQSSDFCGTKFSERKYEWQKFWKRNIKIEISIWQSISVPNSIQSEELQILGRNLPQNYEWKEFWKNKHQNRNKHMVIYLYSKFQSIWRTSDFGTKLVQKICMKRFLKK